MKKLNKLLISLTNRCQNCCPHCSNKAFWDAKDGVTKDLIAAILPLCEEKIQVGFAGGEPLLKFDLLQDITTLFPNGEFYIFTNGILLSDEIILWLKENKVKTYVSVDGPPKFNNGKRLSRGKPNNIQVIDNYFRLKELAPEICGLSTVLYNETLQFDSLYLDWINKMAPTYWQYFLDCNAPIWEMQLYPLKVLISKFRSDINPSINVEPISVTNGGRTHQSEVTPLYIRGDGSFEIPIWGRTWDAEVAKDHLLGNDASEIKEKYEQFEDKYGPLYQVPITPYDPDFCSNCPMMSECKKTDLIKKRSLITGAEPENCLLLSGGLYENPRFCFS